MTHRKPLRVALIWERFGEYHHARMEAASKKFDLHAIEIVPMDDTYAWDRAKAREGYTMHMLTMNSDFTVCTLRRTLHHVLNQVKPQVIAVPGWEADCALTAILWAQRRKSTRVVIMSDSNYRDEERVWWKESLKRGVVSQADAGFAAGIVAKKYLEKLGLAEDRISTGYDVVDNAHFAQATKHLPEKGFLAVARFIEKKNLFTLLDAYMAYRTRLTAGIADWPLTLVGDGELAEALIAYVVQLGLQNHVKFAGFLQYQDLPNVYNAARALILPSTSEQWGLVVNEAMAAGLPVIVSRKAGAADDLVSEGENGWTFDPTNSGELADLMVNLAGDPNGAAEKGKTSRRIIEEWNLDGFANGLALAAEIAMKTPSKRRGIAIRIKLLWSAKLIADFQLLQRLRCWMKGGRP